MKDIVIIGAGGLGREVYSWLITDKRNNIDWKVKGFIDDVEFPNYMQNPVLKNYPIPILNTITDYKPETNDYFILALGEPKHRKLIVEKFPLLNYFTFIHETAILGFNIKIGKGSIICPRSTIACDTKIGDFVLVNMGVTIGHDIEIGDLVTLSNHVDVPGFCKIKEGAYLGSHATLIPKTIVESWAKVAAGSLGVRRIKENTTVLGVPARKFN